MEVIEKENNYVTSYYIDIIKNIFYTPRIFITPNYIRKTLKTMEVTIKENNLNESDKDLINLIIGICHYYLNEYVATNKYLEDLLYSKTFYSTNSFKGIVYTMLTLSNLKLNDIEKHNTYLNLSINFLEENNLNELLIYLYLNVSYNKLEIYNIDEFLYSNINNIFSLLLDYEGPYSSQAYLILGRIYYKFLNLNTIALSLLERSLIIARKNNQREIEMLIYYSQASTYLAMDKFNDGIILLKEILSKYSNKLSSVFKTKIYSKLLELFYLSNPNLSEAKKLLISYKNELYKLDSLYTDLYLTRYNLIYVHYKLFEAGEKINNSLADELYCYLEAASIVYKSNYSDFTFMEFQYWIEISYGDLYRALKDYNNALLHHKRALLFSENVRNKNNIRLYKSISADYESLKDFKTALKYYKVSIDTLEAINANSIDNFYSKIFEDFESKSVLNTVNNNFFTNLSHELKTPVNIIYSLIQLMSTLKNDNDNSIKECFVKYEKTLKQNCLRILKLINNLIDITKIDSGIGKLDLVLLDIVHFIEDLVFSIVPFAKHKNINIIFDTNIEKLYLKVDPYAFERILLNLLSNAIKFNDINGNVFITIHCNDESVDIIVRDDGIGVPDIFIDNLFDRFYKVDTTLSRKYEGSGVGLSITKSLVELHSGTIRINEHYKNGTEFIVNMPIPNQKDIDIKNKYDYFIDDEKILREFSDIYELF
ncbi:sensor histidine kinase [Clostridium sartagoforme]|uniref:histidine kinase n=1 Tax=Clostridium sartagoforme TaxID=84031 RepID=A0A4S2DMN5_9CLOT|nr:tetratricopeptide repeat-containing sensor histidine kinase [Clostridium sartagoforme]TGY43596.1 sensor histidine kinase [Clostridium sartagoforme]